jgi:transcriptional regulator with XRE-family HTH domain
MPTATTAEAVNTEIRAGMARHRLSQSDLGKALGLSQSAVSWRLCGRTEWNLAELITVARLIRTPVVKLIAAADAPRRRRRRSA